MKITDLQEIEYNLPYFSKCAYGAFNDCLRANTCDEEYAYSISNKDIIYLQNLAKRHKKNIDILSVKKIGLVIRFYD